jgi:heme/copper-type cytochrome/quinol oxidase subunit 1
MALPSGFTVLCFLFSSVQPDLDFKLPKRRLLFHISNFRVGNLHAVVQYSTEYDTMKFSTFVYSTYPDT